MGRLRPTVKVTGSGTLAQQDTLIEEAAAWFFLYARFNGTTAAKDAGQTNCFLDESA